MSTYNIGFYEDLTKIIFQLSSNTHLISSSELPNAHNVDIQSKDISIRHLTRKLANWIYTQFLLYTVLLLGKIFLTYN